MQLVNGAIFAEVDKKVRVSSAKDVRRMRQ